MKKNCSENFLSKLAITPTGCLEWTGYTIKSNGYEAHRYGRFNIGGKRLLAHRYAYILAYGEIPLGMNVCHHCDNTKCCNPEHLFIGTQKENMRDMVEKGRSSKPSYPKPKGEKSPCAKLLDAQIIEIRSRRSLGETTTSLAAAYGVHYSYISRLARGIGR